MQLCSFLELLSVDTAPRNNLDKPNQLHFFQLKILNTLCSRVPKSWNIFFPAHLSRRHLCLSSLHVSLFWPQLAVTPAMNRSRVHLQTAPDHLFQPTVRFVHPNQLHQRVKGIIATFLNTTKGTLWTFSCIHLPKHTHMPASVVVKDTHSICIYA